MGIPEGVAVVDALRILGGFTEAELAEAVKVHRNGLEPFCAFIDLLQDRVGNPEKPDSPESQRAILGIRSRSTIVYGDLLYAGALQSGPLILAKAKGC